MVKVFISSYRYDWWGGDDDLDNLINAGLISSSLALIAGSLVNIINNINTKEIERKLMSNFQKIQYSLSLSLIGAIAGAIVITIWSMIKDDKPVNNPFTVSFIMLLLIIGAVLLIVEICYIFKLKNIKFKIELNDGSQWDIIKTTNDKGLLLKHDDTYKIIKDYYNMPITWERK